MGAVGAPGKRTHELVGVDAEIDGVRSKCEILTICLRRCAGNDALKFLIL
jgi:hypothetical protein